MKKSIQKNFLKDRKLYFSIVIVLILNLFYTNEINSQNSSANNNLNVFENKVISAKKMGATHVIITENIPPNMSLFDVLNDPYPAWYMYHPGLLIIFPPEEMKQYMDMNYAEKIITIFQERCKILRKHGLKAAYISKEPHVIPEAFFKDHPTLRGPRCDQVNRSRKARFAPCVDQPKVLELYRESMKLLLEKCPEVEVFSFMTTDAGSGLCWSDGLYPGANGHSDCRTRYMGDRVAGFMESLKNGANDSGKEIFVNIYGIQPRQWMLPTFNQPELIAKQLPANFSIEGFVGPDAQKENVSWFKSQGWSNPVLGLPNVIATMRKFMNIYKNGNPEALVLSPNISNSFEDNENMEFTLKIFEAYNKSKPQTEFELIATLRNLASDLVGTEHSDDLLSLWLAIDQVKHDIAALDFGPIFRMGLVLTRWINRPLVPFPENLTEEEKSYYRPFIFQAKDEKQANNLIDIQAMRMFEGYGAHLLVQRVVEMIVPNLNKARRITSEFISKNIPYNNEWVLLEKSIKVTLSFMRTIDNVVAYQALLEKIKEGYNKVDPNPVLGTQNSWEREAIMRTARNEIDNAANLRELLVSEKHALIQTTSSPENENIRELSPNLPKQLKLKIDIMNNHWEEYDKLLTKPNP